MATGSSSGILGVWRFREPHEIRMKRSLRPWCLKSYMFLQADKVLYANSFASRVSFRPSAYWDWGVIPLKPAHSCQPAMVSLAYDPDALAKSPRKPETHLEA